MVARLAAAIGVALQRAAADARAGTDQILTARQSLHSVVVALQLAGGHHHPPARGRLDRLCDRDGLFLGAGAALTSRAAQQSIRPVYFVDARDPALPPILVHLPGAPSARAGAQLVHVGCARPE